MSITGTEVVHDEDKQRFSLDTDHGPAYVQYRKPDEKTLDLVSTFTPSEERGGGLAAKVVKGALEFARENEMKIVPTCPYVPVYLKRHPEYQDLVK